MYYKRGKTGTYCELWEHIVYLKVHFDFQYSHFALITRIQKQTLRDENKHIHSKSTKNNNIDTLQKSLLQSNIDTIFFHEVVVR